MRVAGKAKQRFVHDWCRRGDLNPQGGSTPRDFESRASADSATPAQSERRSSSCVLIIQHAAHGGKRANCLIKKVLERGIAASRENVLEMVADSREGGGQAAAIAVGASFGYHIENAKYRPCVG